MRSLNHSFLPTDENIQGDKKEKNEKKKVCLLNFLSFRWTYLNLTPSSFSSSQCHYDHRQEDKGRQKNPPHQRKGEDSALTNSARGLYLKYSSTLMNLPHPHHNPPLPFTHAALPGNGGGSTRAPAATKGRTLIHISTPQNEPSPQITEIKRSATGDEGSV